MQLVAEALPLAALGSDLQISSQRFRADIEKLDRTESLFLACKLNLLTSDIAASPEDHLRLQQHAFQLLQKDGLIDDYSVRRIERFIQSQKRPLTYFYRPHFLELIPWLALWGSDKPDGARHARSREAGVAFIRALLMAHEFVRQRLEPRVVQSSEEAPGRLFLEVLPLIRQMSLTTPGVTNPYALLGRSTLLMEAHFFKENPKYLERFTQLTGMTLEEYRDCATLILSVTFATKGATAESLDSLYEFSIEDLVQGNSKTRDLFERFFKHEATTPEGLAKAYHGKSPDGFTDLRPLRERPILTTSSGRSIVMDTTLLAERATYGPLFYAIDKSEEKFQQFGIAFERYVQVESAKRAKVLGCSPPTNNLDGHYATGKDSREVADLAFITPKANVFVQAKGVWLRDDLIVLPSADEFWKEVRAKYSLDGNEDGKSKGVGQLSAAIRGILDGRLILPADYRFDKTLPIFPVLLVHDAHMALPIFAHLLAEEFAKAFDLSAVPVAGFFEWNGSVIHNVILASIDEFENIQHFGAGYDIGSLLSDYSKTDGERKLGIRHFLTRAQQQRDVPDYSDAMQEGRRIVSDISERWFGQPLPEVTG